MKHTGVRCTPEERDELQQLAANAASTPVIALSSEDALRGHDLSSMAWDRVRKRCHEIALSHGLPEIPGYYGVTGDGEFVESTTKVKS